MEDVFKFLLPSNRLCGVEYFVFVSFHSLKKGSRGNKNTLDNSEQKYFLRISNHVMYSWEPAIYSFLKKIIYRKVASGRPFYYSILNTLGQRSQYININFTLLGFATNRDMLPLGFFGICILLSNNVSK